jgi:hypothetical protein
VGLRYRTVPIGSHELAALPSAAQVAIRNTEDSRLGLDRGVIRQKNDSTFDARAQNFARWLARVGYNDVSSQFITARQGGALLEAYFHSLALSTADSLASRTTALGAATLRAYLDAAATWLKLVLGLDIPFKVPASGKLLPNFADILLYAQKWEQPKKKREPYTQLMFEALFASVTKAQKGNPGAFFAEEAVVFDWVRLGIFTGSRGNEYCQTTTKLHDFSKVPATVITGEFGGAPVAFMRSDFTFYDKKGHILSLQDVFTCNDRVRDVHIRFRYDKSKTNFSIRKFRRSIPATYLCAVTASISILLRATLLRVPDTEPLAVVGWYAQSKKCPRAYTYLRSCQVIAVMRRTVIKAYPDPTHQLRKNITCIDCHSNRVTAAVALYCAGVDIDGIAFRLRWSPESVKHYLRDGTEHIGTLCQKVLTGHFLI